MTSRILLERDAPDVQLIVADLLRGHEVVVSGDGAEGLRLASEQQFDLMVLDVMLPASMASHCAGRCASGDSMAPS